MRIATRFLPAALLLSMALILSACQSAEERAEEHYRNALAFVEAGDVDRAIVELRNVFRLNGAHRDARLAMAELMLEQRGNPQEAYSQYLRVAEQYPDDLTARLALAEIAFEAGNWDELARHADRAEALAPDTPRVRAIAAARAYRTAALAGDDEGLRAAAAAAEALRAELPGSLILRSVVIDHAVRAGDHDRALTEIDALIAQDPDNARYQQERLRILARTGDADAIERQLREMVARFPAEPSHKQTLVRFYLAQDRLDAAEDFLRELAAASAPEDSGPTVDLIRFLAETEGADAARAEIEKAIAERPDPVPFRVLGAGLDFASGRQDEAVAVLEATLAGAEPSERTREIKVTLARMLMAMGNEVGARTRVEEVLAEAPTTPAALKMRAGWLIAADDTDAALADLRTALDHAPDDPEIMTLMAAAYERSGRTELQRDFLARAVEASGNAPAESLRYARLLIGEERYMPAEDILLAALRLAPDDADLLLTLGGLYLEMENFYRAQSVADALRRQGSPAAIEAANRLEAERLNRQEGTGPALAYLEELASGAEATLASRIALVQARLGTGDPEGALDLARRLGEEYPDNRSLDVVLAMAQAANGDLDAAEATYRGLLATGAADPAIWLELSRIQQRQGAPDEARATLLEGLAQNPDDAGLLWAQASFLEQDGDVDAAIGIYETLYARESGSDIIANNLASLLASYRDDPASLDRAWRIARRFRDTEIPAIQDTYGWILHRRGESADALPYLEAAAGGLPDDPLVHYHLGQAYLALERVEDAKARFRKAVDLAGPVDGRPQIAEARDLIRRLQDSAAPAEN